MNRLILVFVIGCGRVNFEPIGDGSVPRVCGSAYQPADGLTSKYRHSVIDHDWFAAEADCEADGGHLVVIDSELENNFVLAQLEAQRPLWIGLTDHLVEGTMVWVTGEPLAFERFTAPEPNDVNGEDCAQILFEGDWNDVGCREGAIEYLCECDTQPPAATYCDTEQSVDCGECGAVCNQECINQVCGGGGGG